MEIEKDLNNIEFTLNRIREEIEGEDLWNVLDTVYALTDDLESDCNTLRHTLKKMKQYND